jgi:hypothetical protein
MFDSELFSDTIELLLQGRLFRDSGFVIRQGLIGVVIAAFLLWVMVKVGVSVTIAVLATSVLSGLIQPYLFKDIKFH